VNQNSRNNENSNQDLDNFDDQHEGNPLEVLESLKVVENLEKGFHHNAKKSFYLRKSMYKGLQKFWRRDTILLEERITEEEKEVEYLEYLDKLVIEQDKANIFFYKNMNVYKKAKLYHDKYPFLEFRKKILCFCK
jgi:hypothetical protein